MTNHTNFLEPDLSVLLRPYNPQSPANISRGKQQAGWVLNLYPGAGEASGCFRPLAKPSSGSLGSIRSAEDYEKYLLWKERFREAEDKTRSREEASRRARGVIRRYCAHNQLNRLMTLNFAGNGCHDPKQLRIYLAEFFKKLKEFLGRDFPYLWVPEWHKTNHGLHAHIAVGRYIKRSAIESACLLAWFTSNSLAIRLMDRWQEIKRGSRVVI